MRYRSTEDRRRDVVWWKLCSVEIMASLPCEQNTSNCVGVNIHWLSEQHITQFGHRIHSEQENSNSRTLLFITNRLRNHTKTSYSQHSCSIIREFCQQALQQSTLQKTLLIMSSQLCNCRQPYVDTFMPTTSGRPDRFRLIEYCTYSR